MSKGKKFGEMSYFKPVAGTKIMKEYHDVVYEVEATAEGFICGVLFYKSLSALAPKITGHKTDTKQMTSSFSTLRHGNGCVILQVERCRSGRTGQSRKPLYGRPYRGFESPSLRHGRGLRPNFVNLLIIRKKRSLHKALWALYRTETIFKNRDFFLKILLFTPKLH